jgi:glucose-1-phosphate thymidylyltransferase
MKGIILAGGHGTRLYPLTSNTSKQLLPVYDKPMIYYPLSTLMLSGIREVALISTPRDLPEFQKLLGDGSQWGLKIEFIVQEYPRGLADAFILGEKFIAGSKVCLILGDNIFYGNMRLKETISDFEDGALIFGYPVTDPERYGILEFDDSGNIKNIVEKPKEPKSRYAIPGLYYYDDRVVDFAKRLKPSSRGEIEITDLNLEYLKSESLKVKILGRGIAWLDTGTSDSLEEASSFIKSVEKRQSFKIGCPEEIALRMNFISINQFDLLLKQIPESDYSNYLKLVSEELHFNKGNREKGISNLQI